MKRFIIIFFANLSILVISAIIYYNLSHTHFTKSNNNDVPNLFDYILLATGVQSGAGVTTIYPATNISKFLVSLQLLTIIAMNILVIYVFIKFNVK
jgi:hypothetical protein